MRGSREQGRHVRSTHPQAYFPAGDGKQPNPAEANEKKKFLFLCRFFEGFLSEPGICLFVYFCTGGSSVFSFAGSEAKNPSSGWTGNASQQAVCCFGFQRRTTSFVCSMCFVVPIAPAFQRLIIV